MLWFGSETEKIMTRIALAAAAFALLAFPVAASAAEPPADRSAADDAPTEPLAEVITGAGPGAGPSDVKAKDPPPQKGLLVPAVQKVREAASEEPAEPLEIVVKRAPWTVKAKPAKPK